jgi:hypothetical protein
MMNLPALQVQLGYSEGGSIAHGAFSFESPYGEDILAAHE